MFNLTTCTDIDSLVEQYKLVTYEYNIDGWEQDKEFLLQDETLPMGKHHALTMGLRHSVLELIEMRIEELGGQLPGYGA